MWAKNEEGMDILTFEDPKNQKTAKFFRYTMNQLYKGVDLTKDKPAFVGVKAVDILKKYANK